MQKITTVNGYEFGVYPGADGLCVSISHRGQHLTSIGFVDLLEAAAKYVDLVDDDDCDAVEG